MSYYRVRRLVIAGFAFIALGIGLLAWAVDANAAPRVIEQETLHATIHPQTWESKPLRGTVYLHIYGVHGEIPQRYASGCRASYPDFIGGLYAWVRATDCQQSGFFKLVLRYLSVKGPQRFTAKITRHS